VVIGAGQAGLSASDHLRRLGIDHVSSTRRRRPFSPIPVPLATPSCGGLGRRRGMGSMPQGRPCRQPGSPTPQVPLWVANIAARFVSQGVHGGRLGLSVLSSFKTLRSDGMVVASYAMTSTLRSGRLAGERERGVVILPARPLSFTAANTYPSALQDTWGRSEGKGLVALILARSDRGYAGCCMWTSENAPSRAACSADGPPGIMARMNAYSEDLRMKIVEALRRGITKSEAARSFGVSRSSVKRYVKLADEDRSLAPKKRPGSKPKMDETARRLLDADMEERPAATLFERREFLRQVAGISVSESTISRMLRRLGWSRKKDQWQRESATNS
jgi:transposase